MSVCVITGPMFSGKTTTLLSKIKESIERHGKEATLCLKPSIDDRYDAQRIVTHRGESIECLSILNLSNILIPQNIINIFIDECQFFPDLLQFVLSHQDKHITVAGLKEDFKQEKFGETSDVAEIANDVIILNSKCGWCCENTAQHTARVSTAAYEPQVLVGHSNYFPICGECLKYMRI